MALPTLPVLGTGKLLAWTVLFVRTGEPQTGLVVGETDAGARFVAHPHPAVLNALLEEDVAGMRGRAVPGAERNRFEPA